MRPADEARRVPAAPALARSIGIALELSKARISLFVVFSAFTGALLAGGSHASPLRALGAALLVGCVAAAANVFNQIIERELDGRMRRTAGRPLPSGRVGVREAVVLAAVLATVGAVGLAVLFEVLAALLALSALVAYALVYTPLKRYSSLNTVVGAIPGAAPPLVGAVALTGEPGVWGWSLFAILFAWQFPHFLAIAWLYREDYRRAGMRMLPVVAEKSGVAGRQALAYALLLPPLALLPTAHGAAGVCFALAGLVLGLAYVAGAAGLALREDDRRARRLLHASLLYLPLLFLAALFDPAATLLLGACANF